MAKKVSEETLAPILLSIKKLELDFKKLITKLEETRKNYELKETETRIFDEIRKRLFSVQKQITHILNNSPPMNKTTLVTSIGPPIIIRCKHWMEFKSQATKAQSLSFLCREEDKTFQVDAVKENRIYTYSGQLPEMIAMLKAWLAKQLAIEEEKVLEGVLAIG